MGYIAQLPTNPLEIQVFTELQQHKAMPLLEIASVTGVQVSTLTQAVTQLAANDFVELNGNSDPSTMIVSLSGKFS